MKMVYLLLFLFSFSAMAVVNWKLKITYPTGEEKVFIPTEKEFSHTLPKTDWTCFVKKTVTSKALKGIISLDVWEGRYLVCSYKNEAEIKGTLTCLGNARRVGRELELKSISWKIDDKKSNQRFILNLRCSSGK